MRFAMGLEKIVDKTQECERFFLLGHIRKKCSINYDFNMETVNRDLSKMKNFAVAAAYSYSTFAHVEYKEPVIYGSASELFGMLI